MDNELPQSVQQPYVQLLARPFEIAAAVKQEEGTRVVYLVSL